MRHLKKEIFESVGTYRYRMSLGNHKPNPAFNEVGDDDGVGRNHYPPLFEKRHCFFHLPRKRDDIGKVQTKNKKKKHRTLHLHLQFGNGLKLKTLALLIIA